VVVATVVGTLFSLALLIPLPIALFVLLVYYAQKRPPRR